MNREIFEKIRNTDGLIVKDNREVKSGDIFLALKGENFDAHDFVADAIAKGASYAIVDRKIADVDQDKLIIVDDTLKALQEIAAYHRENCKAKVIGITGSNGKTSTKELLKAGLENQGKTYATAGNLNNHIGLPLTLANAPIDSDFIILEMGMNHTGELLDLTKIAKPDIVIVTNVGKAHHEFFPTIEDIAMAKAEIFSGLNEDGIAFIHNGDLFPLLKEQAIKNTNKVFAFGKTGDVKILDYNHGNIKAEIFSEEINYDLQVIGEHQAINSIAVLGVIKLLEKDIKQAAVDMAKLKSQKGRGETSTVPLQKGSFTLIDDAYNASPDSMIASLKTLKYYKGSRKIAVLGEMRELGELSSQLHKDLLPEIIDADIDKVFCCCGNMRNLYNILPIEKQGGWAEDSASLWEIVKDKIELNDIVLVKGSLGSKMLLIVDNIKKIKEE